MVYALDGMTETPAARPRDPASRRCSSRGSTGTTVSLAAAQAMERFELADWVDAQHAVRERIRFYDERARECVERLRGDLAAEELDDATWQRVKLHYIGLLVDHKRPELAETFFNSVITRILHRTYAHNDVIFVRAAVSTEYIESDPPSYRSYYPAATGLAGDPSPPARRLRLAAAVRRPRSRHRPRRPVPARARGRDVAGTGAQPSDPGAELRLLPQQGGPRRRQGGGRPPRDPLCRPRAP